MASAFFRIGTKVETRDRSAELHGRAPERMEAVGIIKDLWSPYGQQTRPKDKKPPYLVEFPDGSSAWYDAHEVERPTTKVAKRKAEGERQSKKYREARQIAEAIQVLGLSSKVRKIYDWGQDIGLDRFDVDEVEKMTEEEREVHSHNRGIEAVWEFLIEEKVITPDTKEEIIALAFSELS